MTCIDELLSREYKPTYTCNEFACEAWQLITGENLNDRLMKWLNDPDSQAFKRLDHPISPCLVMFKNHPRSSTHVGLFFEGKLLHLSARGAQFVPIEVVALHFRSVSYYQ